MASEEIALMAHLMRRAGFGATREELEARASKGYEATVEELLDTGSPAEQDRSEMMRYHPWAWRPGTIQGMGAAEWMRSMLNTNEPLAEKMTLFWHQVFATGVSKVDHYDEVNDMVVLFRNKGMGNYRELLLELAKNPAMIYWLDNCENTVDAVNENWGRELLELAKNPAMIYWLDNCENTVDAVNENWGRELLELFSMGVGNYTEVDVRECSRAFTGWTIRPKLPRGPIGRTDWFFEYREENHDDTEKTFLGETGNFNGEDIIDIVCNQPATAQFIARHLYNFFVADEAQVPAWAVTPPRDEAAIDLLTDTFIESNYDIRSVLRVLFTSDFFKESRFARLKSPTEVVVGTLRLVGGAEFPAPGIGDLARQPCYMGQDLLNPPSVEGWHTGSEWINSGSLMRRVNFTADYVGDTSRPGIQSMISRLRGQGIQTPEQLVDGCLDLMGPLEVTPESHKELVDFISEKGEVRWDTGESSQASTERVGELLQLIVSLREYQYA